MSANSLYVNTAPSLLVAMQAFVLSDDDSDSDESGVVVFHATDEQATSPVSASYDNSRHRAHTVDAISSSLEQTHIASMSNRKTWAAVSRADIISTVHCSDDDGDADESGADGVSWNVIKQRKRNKNTRKLKRFQAANTTAASRVQRRRLSATYDPAHLHQSELKRTVDQATQSMPPSTIPPTSFPYQPKTLSSSSVMQTRLATVKPFVRAQVNDDRAMTISRVRTGFIRSVIASTNLKAMAIRCNEAAASL